MADDSVADRTAPKFPGVGGIGRGNRVSFGADYGNPEQDDGADSPPARNPAFGRPELPGPFSGRPGGERMSRIDGPFSPPPVEQDEDPYDGLERLNKLLFTELPTFQAIRSKWNARASIRDDDPVFLIVEASAHQHKQLVDALKVVLPILRDLIDHNAERGDRDAEIMEKMDEVSARLKQVSESQGAMLSVADQLTTSIPAATETIAAGVEVIKDRSWQTIAIWLGTIAAAMTLGLVIGLICGK